MNHQQLLRRAVGLMFVIFLLAACNSLQSAQTPTPDMTPGQVRGTLLDNNQQPLKGYSLALYRIVRSEEESPQDGDEQSSYVVTQFIVIDEVWTKVVDAGVTAKTDSSGIFIFENLPPGEYVPYSKVQSDAKFTDPEGEVLVFTLPPGQVVDLQLQINR